MKSTSAEATIIQAVSAELSLGGSAASASGACTRKGTARPRTCTTDLRACMQLLPVSEFMVHGAPGEEHTVLCDVLGVETEGTAPSICEPVLERHADRAERDFLPRDLAFLHQ